MSSPDASATPPPAGFAPLADAAQLAPLLANRRWVRRARPFPHVLAHDVFVEPVYRAIDERVRALTSGNRQHLERNMPGYDATGSTLDRHRDGPLGVFASRAWHDAIAAAVAVRCTGDVSGSLHHHEVGSASGWPHNDLNPGWFGAAPPPPGSTAMPVDAGIDYHRGTGSDTRGARETVRAVSVLFYVGNGPWRPGDGGETALFRAARPDAHAVLVPPVDNSMVIFECTPFSWHAFVSNVRTPRNAVVMWLHRDRRDVVARWGEQSIVGW